MRSSIKLIAAAAVLLLLITPPVAAVVQEKTVAGTITNVNQAKGTIDIYADKMWNGVTWTGISVQFVADQKITGTAPSSDAMAYLCVGDTVQATFTGESPQASWVTVSKVDGTDPTGKFLIASFGDPSKIVNSFQNNFKVTFDTAPDCESCSGSVCTASSAYVKVVQGWNEKNFPSDAQMIPGERHVFKSPEGCLQELSVTFLNGEASAGLCSAASPVGRQPFSVFTIEVVQKGSVQDYVPLPVVQTVETEVPTPVPTQASPGFGFVIAVIGIVAAIAAFTATAAV
ncbi:MAG: hypothetical protein IKT21_01290, partial [Methanomicrobium sp.]|nr:hypothetical protein [Methanomicrobium sp.]